MKELLTICFSKRYRIYFSENSPHKHSAFKVRRPRLYARMIRIDPAITDGIHPEEFISYEQLLAGIHIPDADMDDFSVADIPSWFTFWLTANMEKYSEYDKSKWPEHRLFNLGDNPMTFSSCIADPTVLPTITRTSTRLYHIERQRWLTAPERALSQGLPITQWAALALSVNSCGNKFLSLPVAKQSSLAGKTMHFSSIYIAWLQLLLDL